MVVVLVVERVVEQLRPLEGVVDTFSRGLHDSLDARLVRRPEALLEGGARLDDGGQVHAVLLKLADGLVREDEMEPHAPGLLKEEADVLGNHPLKFIDEDVDALLLAGKSDFGACKCCRTG